MATWTTVPDASLEPGKPIRSIDALALRDNPVAIAEGASGAPKIQAAALDTGTDEIDWVLGRNAGAAVGAIGTYAFLGETTSTVTQPGGTRAGSGLRYVGIHRDDGSWGSNINSVLVGLPGSSSTIPSGTWRCMGFSPFINVVYGATLWLRIS